MSEKTRFVKGAVPIVQVKIIKVKNNTPTIINVFGNEYVARPNSMFKGNGK